MLRWIGDDNPSPSALLAAELLLLTAAPWLMPVRARRWLIGWPGTWVVYALGGPIVLAGIWLGQGSPTAGMLLAPLTFGFGLIPRGSGLEVHAALLLHHAAPVAYLQLEEVEYLPANAGLFLVLWLAHAVDALDSSKLLAKRWSQPVYLGLVGLAMVWWWLGFWAVGPSAEAVPVLAQLAGRWLAKQLFGVGGWLVAVEACGFAASAGLALSIRTLWLGESH